MKPDVWMLYIPNSPTSMYYRGRVENSWSKYKMNFFEAVTPETLHEKDYLKFGRKQPTRKRKTVVDFSPTEKATWYSHVELWKKALEKPILIIEHDAMMTKKIDDKWWNMDIVCFGYNKRPGKQLAGLAYYLTPKIANELVKRALRTNPIDFNPDALIHHLCKRYGKLDCQHVLQFSNKLIGNTIEHNYNEDV